MVLTAISLECGYPASSLRERIFAAPDYYGILIYTGSSDAEGTLGGLAMAGRDASRHMRRALESGELCSNDPVCAHHVPARHDGQQLLGSACHGCNVQQVLVRSDQQGDLELSFSRSQSRERIELSNPVGFKP